MGDSTCWSFTINKMAKEVGIWAFAIHGSSVIEIVATRVRHGINCHSGSMARRPDRRNTLHPSGALGYRF
jgi:hypothetical protein